MRVFSTVIHAVSSVFGCSHERTSRPFTIDSQSYMVCLTCGQKLFYSPETMRRLSRREVTRLLRQKIALANGIAAATRHPDGLPSAVGSAAVISSGTEEIAKPEIAA